MASSQRLLTKRQRIAPTTIGYCAWKNQLKRTQTTELNRSRPNTIEESKRVNQSVTSLTIQRLPLIISNSSYHYYKIANEQHTRIKRLITKIKEMVSRFPSMIDNDPKKNSEDDINLDSLKSHSQLLFEWIKIIQQIKRENEKSDIIYNGFMTEQGHFKLPNQKTLKLINRNKTILDNLDLGSYQSWIKILKDQLSGMITILASDLTNNILEYQQKFYNINNIILPSTIIRNKIPKHYDLVRFIKPAGNSWCQYEYWKQFPNVYDRGKRRFCFGKGIQPDYFEDFINRYLEWAFLDCDSYNKSDYVPNLVI